MRLLPNSFIWRELQRCICMICFFPLLRSECKCHLEGRYDSASQQDFNMSKGHVTKGTLSLCFVMPQNGWNGKVWFLSCTLPKVALRQWLLRFGGFGVFLRSLSLNGFLRPPEEGDMRSARLPKSEDKIRKCEELDTDNAINTYCPSGVLWFYTNLRGLYRVIEWLDLEEALEVSSPTMTITVCLVCESLQTKSNLSPALAFNCSFKTWAYCCLLSLGHSCKHKYL